MPYSRLEKDDYYMGLAYMAAARSTCIRRSVGCVLVSMDGRVLSTGFNGTPRGAPHCIDEACPGALEPSGQGLDKCLSAHAEVNALLQCPNTMEVWRVYCTTKPCFECIKALMNTPCVGIIYGQAYPHTYDTGNIIMRPHDSQFLNQLKEMIRKERDAE